MQNNAKLYFFLMLAGFSFFFSLHSIFQYVKWQNAKKQQKHKNVLVRAGLVFWNTHKKKTHSYDLIFICNRRIWQTLARISLASECRLTFESAAAKQKGNWILFFQHRRAASFTWRVAVQEPKETSAPRCSHQHLTSFLAGNFQTNPSQLSHLQSLLKPRVNECIPPRALVVLTPALAIVILGSNTQQNPKQWQNALFAKFLCAQKSAPSHAALKWYPEKEPDIKLPPGEKKRNKEIIKKEKGNRRAEVSTAKDSDEEGGGGGGQLQSA